MTQHRNDTKQVVSQTGKRAAAWLLGLILLLALFIPAAQAESKLIADPALEKVVRSSIHKSSGELTPDDLLKLKEIYAFQNEGITSLKGLEYAKNLTMLIVSGQPLDSLAEIAELTKINFIDISNTQVADLSPLKNLTQLRHLSASHANISDLRPLAGLTRMNELFLANNQIEDVTPLASMRFVWLELSGNRINDLSPLWLNGDSLGYVYVSDNSIADLLPVLTSNHLNTVYADGNPLDEYSLVALRSLQEQGVEVKFDDQPAPGISVEIDGEWLAIDGQVPLLIDGNTFVPLRSIFEALGAKVDWNQADRSVMAVKGSSQIKLQIGSRKASVNGTEVKLEVEPQLVGDYTMVPVRFVSEALGAEVKWDGVTRTVSIRTTGTTTN
ncbi:leucine-rich repeat domain-containing protein [Paenibacillus athensensis]|uniref:Copper amine oxidase-like N-terminal domain-containing protein n=1 Tax=Paenibacillus athensensis TaxID=1967502 RepID=A0A4Y8Q178_9BACL|nr:stalk domain-containing protein [Paenibacillus athensensis]MCD1261152.1 leucine-rich repeat domain-containing protein [Paenibacillus athensensis]